MKRILSILLALVLIFSMAACAPKDTNPPEEPDNGGENQQTPDENGGNEGGEEDNTPTPEQLLEQQKEALKQQLLEEINSDAGIMNLSGSLESPTALITALERDFSVDQIMGSKYAPRGIYQKGNELVILNPDFQIYTVEKGDLVFQIWVDDNNEPEVFDCVPKSAYSSSILTALNFDVSSIGSSSMVGMPEIPETDSMEIPTITAEDLTVSDDLNTVTISDTWIKAVLAESMLASAGAENQEQVDEILQTLQASATYTISENKINIIVTYTPEALDSEITLDVIIAYTEQDGFTMEFTFLGEMESAGIKVPFKATLAYRNIKYREGKAISGELETSMETSAKETVLGQTFASTYTNSLKLVIDLTNEQAPTFSAVAIQKQDSTVNGKPYYDMSFSAMQTLDATPYSMTYSEESDSTTLLYYTGRLIFDTPAYDTTAPELIRQYVDSVYSEYLDLL